MIAAENRPVQLACRILGVSESGFYEQRKRPSSERAIRHAMLTDLITQVHAESHGTYGILRIHAELTMGRGVEVGHNQVGLLMRRAGLQGAAGRRKWKRIRPDNIATDLVDRTFARSGPNQLWVTDITEHPTREGKVYCCVVLDTYSRRVVGWSIDASPTAALVTNALGMAIDSRLGKTTEPGTIIHSDQGVQGEFKWSSQHLDQEVVRWALGRDRSRFVTIGGRSLRRGGRRLPGARTGSGSGPGSPAGSRPRTRVSRRACPGRSGSGGFATLAA